MRGATPALSGLPIEARSAVAAARAIARRRGLRLYIAGGAVRDLLCGRPVADIDLVVEGAAGPFARELAPALRASLRVHDRFGTATLERPDGSRLDVASARTEQYSSDGALPAVAPAATIREDLARRDFTINAMALEVAPGRRLLDPFGGRSDLARKVVRALHSRSFRDDPTRAFRAVRYANRFRFRIASGSRRAIADAVAAGVLENVSGDRIRREIAKILAEPNRAAAVRRLDGLRLGAAIDRALASRNGSSARLRAAEGLARDRPGVTWLGYLLAWAGAVPGVSARRIASRLRLSGAELVTWNRWPQTRRRLGPGLSRLRASEAARRAAGLSVDEIVAASASLGAADRRALAEAETRASAIRLKVSGSDLLAAGVPSGPAIGRALARTLAARRDGHIAAEEELTFAIGASRARIRGR